MTIDYHIQWLQMLGRFGCLHEHMPARRDPMWARLHRTMARRNWKSIRVIGESGAALVFLAVPR